MSILQMYNNALDKMQREYRTQALEALEKGNERAHSVAMMQYSMCGDMLHSVGQAIFEKTRTDFPQKLFDDLEKEKKFYLSKEDYDMADRASVKAQTLQCAMDILERLVKENA